MPTPLRVLLVEVNLQDATLVLRELKRSGFEVVSERVDSEAAFLEGLRHAPELILSDSSMPQFDGMHALELLKQSGLEAPFIVMSGNRAEAFAAKALQQGASACLHKDDLASLGPAVCRALAQMRIRPPGIVP
jgi:CheY-like chemotaxis protein